MEIFLVGGAVRDRLLGVPVEERDWVVVGATPEEMESAGYVSRTREGRRNTYEVNGTLPLRHPIEGHQSLDALIKLILKTRPRTKR